MVICVGFDPYNGYLHVFNSKTGDTKSLIANECDPKNMETISELFEFIKTNVTEESIDYFCVFMGPQYKNEIRQKFVEIAQQNRVKNVKIIGGEKALLFGAIDEHSIFPKMNNEIWGFYIDADEINCLIWKFDEYNEWKLQNYVVQQRTEKRKDKSPTLEDLQKLKEKMKIGNEIPYIYVNNGDCISDQEDFKALFPQYRKIIFPKYAYFSKWALNYARFMSGQEGFSKYKSQSLLAYTIQIKNHDDTEILSCYAFQVLPFSQVFEGNFLTSTLSIKKEGKYQIDIDIDGIYTINLKPIDAIFEDLKSFTIPLNLNNYDSSSNAIGIDLGTTECCAAVIRKNGPDFVVLDIVRNSRAMPSFIAYDEREVKFGQIVVDRMRFKAEYAVFDTKRILGKKMDDIIMDPLWPFKIISPSANGNNIQIEVETFNGKKSKTCEEITANLVFHIKTTLETYQGKELFETVITIPSGFSELQKAATLNAARMAGFQKIHFLPEPIAAAFAYFSELKIPKNSKILICDCGGGTVDVCIAKINKHELKISTFDGDSHLGGRDFDTILFTHFSGILKHKFGIDVMKTNKKFVLKQKYQNIKHTLSARIEDWLDVSDFESETNEIINISREEFEEMSVNLLLKIRSVIIRAVSNSKLERSQIVFVFQVGGGCRMPMIKEMLKEIFPASKHECNLYPDWVVAHGAAIYAYQLSSGLSTSTVSTNSVIALFEYQAKQSDEISLVPDDIITEVEEVEDGWYKGRAPSGQCGLFPSNFVKPL